MHLVFGRKQNWNESWIVIWDEDKVGEAEGFCISVLGGTVRNLYSRTWQSMRLLNELKKTRRLDSKKMYYAMVVGQLDL